jgi:hypothetical protein
MEIAILIIVIGIFLAIMIGFDVIFKKLESLIRKVNDLEPISKYVESEQEKDQ